MSRYSFDYTHLQGRTPEQVFAETLAKGAPGDCSPWFPERVNRDLIRLFQEREVLHLSEASAVYGSAFAKATHSPQYTADRAASLLAWGVRLGIIEQSVERHVYVWRMPDRELRWETRGGQAVQVRGLPDGEQAAMNRKRASQAKAAATRQRKAAEALAPRIAAAVDGLLEVRADFIAPDHPHWRDPMPNARLPCPLVELRPMLLEAHYAMDPRRQRQWLQQLRTTAWIERCARDLGPDRRPGEAAAALVIERVPAPVPAHVRDLEPMADEDAAALEDLA